MLIIAVIIAALASWYFYRRQAQLNIPPGRRWLLGVLRFTSLLVLLVLLLNPVLNFSNTHTQKPVALMLKDTSASMDLPLANLTKKTWFDSLATITAKQLQQAGYQTKSFDFADGLNGNPQATYLNKTVSDLAKQEQLTDAGGIWLFSDGWLEDDNLQPVIMSGLAVNTFVPAKADSIVNLSLGSPKSNPVAYTDEETPFYIQANAVNYQGKATLTVTNNSKTIASYPLDFTTHQNQQVELSHTFKQPGLEVLEFNLSSPVSEPLTADNVRSCAIAVKKARLGTAVITTVPGWDSAFWVKAINRGKRSQATLYLLKNGTLYQNNQQVAIAKALEQVKTVVMVNSGPGLNQVKTDIANFVNAGGGLIWVGPVDQAYFSILPFKSLQVRGTYQDGLAFTPASKRLQSFSFSLVPDIPPLNYNYVEAVAGAQVLANFTNPEQTPALAWHSIGQGRILALAGLGLWHWQLWQPGNLCFDFMNNLNNWLGAEQGGRFNVTTNANQYRPGQSVQFSLQAWDEQYQPRSGVNALLKIFDASGNQVKQAYFAPGNQNYTATLKNLDPGTWSWQASDALTNEKATGSFFISSQGQESFNHGINRGLLGWLASQTGGQVGISANLPTITKVAAQQITTTKSLPLMQRWWFWGIFVAAFGLELFLRRRWGLL